MIFRVWKRKYYKNYELRFKELYKTLKEISELKDNWDQYGAKPLSKTVISDFDYYFLSKFKKSKLSHSAIMHNEMVYAALYPSIHPTANDTIQFDIQPNVDFYFEYTQGKITTVPVITSSIYVRMVICNSLYNKIPLQIKKELISFPDVLVHLQMFYIYYITYLRNFKEIPEDVYLKFLNSILLA